MTLPVRVVSPGTHAWETQGCEFCRTTVLAPSRTEPRFLGDSVPPGDHIYRCGSCGAYWREGWSNPREISQERALEDLPDLAARERAAGLE